MDLPLRQRRTSDPRLLGRKLIEEYTYNQAEQRVRQWRGKTLHDDPTAGALHYDHQGKLTRAGRITFDYDSDGALAERHERRDKRFFSESIA